ncbi:hypothetical protein [Sodaliphilus sp.]|uniref:hypothetical protein n=1 Tax=Sodaliphilus sp. TaxID=2815818 RepID=UPI00388DA099
MNNKLLSLMLLIIAAVAFTSCNDDEPAPQYTYFKPGIDWNATPADVRAYMAASPGWTETTSTDNTVFFKNERTQTAIIYAFNKGTLAASIVTVSGFNDHYNDLKNQIAKDYGLTFKETSMLDFGIKPELMLNVLMHRFTTYMTAAYIDLDFLNLLELDPNNPESIKALIDKIKAGLMPTA